MKHMKTIILLLISLTLVFVATAMVSAQDPNDFYGDYNPEVPWGAFGLFTGALCIIPIIMIVIGIALAIWVYKDAEKRGSSGALWLIIVLITGILGLIIWLVVRPPIGGKKTETAASSSDRRCPSCGRAIPDDARVCPYCGKNFEG